MAKTSLTLQQERTLHAQAYLLMQCGKTKEAYRLFRTLVKIAADPKPLWPAVAISALKAEEFLIASQLCHKLVELPEYQENHHLWLCYSRALWHQGQAESARNAYRRFLAWQPNKSGKMTHSTATSS